MRRLVDERRIAFHKVGRYVRFDPADVDRFAVQGRVEPEGA
jgi:excisionase family DNA binding protein